MEVTLRDGQRAFIRPVRRDDAGLIYKYFQGLSKASRGFFHPHAFDRENAQSIADDTGSKRSFRVLATVIEGEGAVGYAWFSERDQQLGFPVLGIGVFSQFEI